MKIYTIYRDSASYDENQGHVIVANNRKEVRHIAKAAVRAEAKRVWNSATIKCIGRFTKLNEVPHIVMTDFIAVY